MSDTENGDHSRDGSMSPRGKHQDDLSDEESKVISYRSRSKEMDKYSRSPKSKHRYSRSRSRSRSHRRSKRSRSKYRSRSRSHGRYRAKYSRSMSRSRSHSYSSYRGSRKYYRSTSRSPMSNRKRHNGTRENPKPSKCLGVFGLSIYTTENHLQYIFSKFGSISRVQVVIDAKTGRSRGFAFVYFDTVDDAKNAKDQCLGMEIDGRKIRVDFSITQRAHTPTPGIYMGKPTYSDTRWREDDYYGGSSCGGGSRRGGYERYRHSPSPYYKRSRRHDRSRSRSYSPRRYY